ncbi:hypothetical protein GCM10010483_60330 [Actinokineospora diospyrosa]
MVCERCRPAVAGRANKTNGSPCWVWISPRTAYTANREYIAGPISTKSGAARCGLGCQAESQRPELSYYLRP